ncbi:MAG: hypothetical protein E7369_01780 [Clostridiales bacterium]|nr:hypothetical protein [Clostridiales bacterium]
MNKFLKSFKNGLTAVYFFILIGFAITLSCFPNLTKSVTDGIGLWAGCVLPTLFPYLFITFLLNELTFTTKLAKKISPLTKRLFNTGGQSGYAFFISVTSGYPVGAKTVADLTENGLLSPEEGQRACTFCSTSSPTFLISSVGNVMFGSIKFGLVLFLINLVSAVLVGIIFSFYKRKSPPTDKWNFNTKRSDNPLYEGVTSSVISVLAVGGLITVFYTLTEVLRVFGVIDLIESGLSLVVHDPVLSEGLALGLFECTKGLKHVANTYSLKSALPICAFICGFGGLSVIAQSVAFLKKAKIKTAVFIASKLLTAVISLVLGLLFSHFF